MNDNKLIFCDTGLLLKSRNVGRTDPFFMDSFNKVYCLPLAQLLSKFCQMHLFLALKCSGINFIRFVSTLLHSFEIQNQKQLHFHNIEKDKITSSIDNLLYPVTYANNSNLNVSVNSIENLNSADRYFSFAIVSCLVFAKLIKLGFSYLAKFAFWLLNTYVFV